MGIGAGALSLAGMSVIGGWLPETSTCDIPVGGCIERHIGKPQVLINLIV